MRVSAGRATGNASPSRPTSIATSAVLRHTSTIWRRWGFAASCRSPSIETVTAAAPPPVSVKELMAAFLARDMRDGGEIFVGTNLPVIRAGALLAHLHHGPNMRVMVAHTRTNLHDTPVMEHFELLNDWHAGRLAEA